LNENVLRCMDKRQNRVRRLIEEGVLVSQLFCVCVTRPFMSLFFYFCSFPLLAADPHPGNMLRTPDGKLVILDFGLMTQVGTGPA